MRIVFLGPPGAGKGTQAELAAARLKIPHISTGDMLRSAVARGTPAGKDAAEFMNAGKLVPDPVVLKMLEERLREPDARSGFILDGYPRNVEQAISLASLTQIDRVVFFSIDLGALEDRLVERRVCPQCQAVYNLKSNPPRVDLRCDRDGITLVQRPDDRREVVEARFKTYLEQTEPLVRHYQELKLLQTIRADGTPEAIAKEVTKVLD
jgi:adenylate kinase